MVVMKLWWMSLSSYSSSYGAKSETKNCIFFFFTSLPLILWLQLMRDTISLETFFSFLLQIFLLSWFQLDLFGFAILFPLEKKKGCINKVESVQPSLQNLGWSSRTWTIHFASPCYSTEAAFALQVWEAVSKQPWPSVRVGLLHVTVCLLELFNSQRNCSVGWNSRGNL